MTDEERSALFDLWLDLYNFSPGFLCLFSGRRSDDGRLHDVQDAFFAWPDFESQAAAHAERESEAGREVYHCAHLLTQEKRKKRNAAAVWALWSEDFPIDQQVLPEPSVIIETSPRRHQAYWKLTASISPVDAESLNRRLAYKLQSDPSGWDLTQLLRVPFTRSWKHDGAKVKIVAHNSELAYDAALFEALLPQVAEPKAVTRSTDGEPPVRLSPEAMEVWRGKTIRMKEAGGADRSIALMQIGRVLHNAGATRTGIVAALCERDHTLGWHKYADRTDGDEQYHRIVDKLEEATASSVGQEEQELTPDGFVGLAAEFADLYQPHTETPRAFLYFAFLTAVGSLLAERVTMRSDLHHSMSPRLFTVMVAPTGERKSSALALALNMLEGAFPELPVQHGVGSGEGLAHRLASTSSLLLAVDELSLLISKAQAEGSILLPLLCSLFERTSFDNETLTRPLHVRDAYLSLIALTTEEKYDRIWTRDFIRSGFVNRVWLVWSGRTPRRLSVPGSVPAKERNEFVARVRSRLEDIVVRPHRTELVLTPGAQAVWDRWYLNQQPSPYGVRLDVYGWRFMVLLSVCQGLDEVSEETAQRVCSLLDHQLALRKAHDPIDAETRIAVLEERIRRALARQPLTKRGLQRVVNANREGVGIFTRALENLQQVGDVAFDRKVGYRLEALP